jgi:hypothetical protein
MSLLKYLIPVKLRNKKISHINKKKIEYLINIDGVIKIKKIHMVLGNYLLNSRCHENAVQKVMEKKATSVIFCMLHNKKTKELFAHFINKKKDKYQDNSLGYLHKNFDYYYIGKVHKKEYDSIIPIMISFKEKIYKVATTKLERLFFNREDL